MFLCRYASAGSMAPDRPESEHDNTWSQKVIGGAGADGRGGILRLTQDGKPVEDKFNLDSEYPVNLYYAYGIRNSFGMDFDPASGFLWDIENGATGKDENNFVKPGFNSGWRQVWVYLHYRRGLTSISWSTLKIKERITIQSLYGK